MLHVTPFLLLRPATASTSASGGATSLTSYFNIKLFKGFSKKKSLVQKKKSKSNRKLKFKLKKRGSKVTNEEVNVVTKSSSPLVQDENNEPEVEDRTLVDVNDLVRESNQIRPVVKNVSCRTDFTSLPAINENIIKDRADINCLLQVSDKQICVDDNLEKTYMVHVPSRNFQPSSDEPLLSPTQKVHMYLASIDGVTFDTIYDVDSQFEYSRATLTNRSCANKLLSSSESCVTNLYPNIPQKDEQSYQQTFTLGKLQSKSQKCSRAFKRLDCYSFSSTYRTTVTEPMSGDSINYFNEQDADSRLSSYHYSTSLQTVEASRFEKNNTINLNWSVQESNPLDEYGEDEVFQEPSTQRSSFVNGPEQLFGVTVFRDENGFGFSLEGDCPPRVASVDKDSPAEEAGIMEGDKILKVNTQDVYMSYSETVALFIRAINPQCLVLDLHRDYQTTEVTAFGSDRGPRNDLTEVSLCQSFLGETRSEDADLTDPNTTFVTTIFLSPSESQLKTLNDMSTDLKHLAIRRLMSLEEEYIAFMHSGIEKFSRPLRQFIFSSHQYRTIFQNIEKLVAISEYNVQEMKDKNASINDGINNSQFSDHSLFVFLPALAYEPKADLLCQAYEAYARGFEQSLTMLQVMRRNKHFVKFLKETENEISDHQTLIAFINRPILHILAMYKILDQLLTLTSEHSPDFGNLQILIAQLTQCVQTVVSLYSDQKIEDLILAQDNLNVKTTRTDKPTMISPIKVRSIEALRPIDITSRLILAPNLREYQSYLKSMFMIYHGIVHKSNGYGLWIKYEFILLSNLLLMARDRSDGSMFVRDSPIHIQDLQGLEISSAHASEFVLHLGTVFTEKASKKQSNVCHFDRSGSTMILRAASEQDRFVWKSVLEQRVQIVTNRSLHVVFHTELV